jgi:PAS domain S-box-containing protein
MADGHSPADGREDRLPSTDTLLRLTPHPYQSLDRTASILTVNDAWLEAFGYGRAEVEGEWFGQFLDDESADRFEDSFSTFREEGSVADLQLAVQHADGHTIAVSFDGRIEYDDEGSFLRTHCQLNDITERREYETRLQEQRDNLNLLNQVLRHDIRNDLQIVLAYGELLTDHVDAERREYVDNILENASHAVELTTNARDMADVMLSTEGDHQPVGLRKALEGQLDELRTVYSDAVITVEGSLPEVRICADDMVDSVFRNLLKNAIEHNDTEVPTVTVSVRVDTDHVTVRVADNGPGVSDDQKEAIFGKGEKGLESHGSGIGLYLVKTLVENYGGTVRVEDNDPRGAVFVAQFVRAG